MVPIHRQPTKDESFVILRGKVRVTTHKDDGSIIEEVVLRQESGNYGVDISKGVWHMVEALEAGSVMFGGGGGCGGMRWKVYWKWKVKAAIKREEN